MEELSFIKILEYLMLIHFNVVIILILIIILSKNKKIKIKNILSGIKYQKMDKKFMKIIKSYWNNKQNQNKIILLKRIKYKIWIIFTKKI